MRGFSGFMANKPSTAKHDFFAWLSETHAVQSLLKQVEDGGVFTCNGVSCAAQPFVCVLLSRHFPNRPVLAVTEGTKTQERFHQDVDTWLGFGRKETKPKGAGKEKSGAKKSGEAIHSALFYPAWETLPHESQLPHADVISERLETLIALSTTDRATRPSPVLVAQVASLLQRTFKPETIRQRTRILHVGDRIDPMTLIDWLVDQGYEPEAQVTQKGEIAHRGGILDVHPLTSPWPVRMEFFGDELESLRWFDPLTQISREPIDSFTLSPAGELGILKRLVEEKSLPEDDSATVSDPLATLIDYLPTNAILLLCEPEALAERSAGYEEQVPEGDPFFRSWNTFLDAAIRKGLTVVRLYEEETSAPGLEIPEIPEEPNSSLNRFTLGFSNLETFHRFGERLPQPEVAEIRRREFFNQLHRWLRQDYRIRVFCNNEGERDRFCEVWAEYGFGSLDPNEHLAAEKKRSKAASGKKSGSVPEIHLGALSSGFLHEPGKVVVITDAEVFGRYKVQRPRRLKSPHAAAARSLLDIDFTELEEGDYVVHLQHGIGRYLGLKSLPLSPNRNSGADSPRLRETGQECLVIEYAASDSTQASPKLYVPVTESHLVSKYVGAGKANPHLNTLGGGRWAKTKAQAEKAVRDVASDLLAIQAARESRSGHAFALDTPWQRDFESAFLYEETPDQMRSILEAKRDMESSRPMDRLVCGDVGYGKTEVAIRAAFKGVMDGRQVAVLVPTTILAQQHFNTFRERMADYPIRIEQLSRFCSRRDQKRVVQQLAEGSVDIVIGTHRLIQADIAFKDLGLVIIDEEQRFGVLHKEKLKQLRTMVDVLTLSATPIPRTLYLALTGARDMSTIETPPQDRLPVETIVAQYDERLIRDAIKRELNREGQVYFLHNRILSIDHVADRIRELAPEARIIVGHGQMDSDKLEEIMARFINGDADVLVSTTIIESGIDIPNANTIIIDRADRFGLSDLYQLRGRVGRYKHQAYAFLLLPRHATLLTDVRKRISAIRQYSSLGSGFKIAMRDLEIRGAGNMLGSEQSGHITAVGFDLYCQLLKQSISSAKGERIKPRLNVELRLDFIALNPDEESASDPGSDSVARQPKSYENISVPRETATYTSEDSAAECKIQNPESRIRKAPAYIPFAYVNEPRHRIEIYRKVAQATEKADLSRIQAELKDRFGKPPAAIDRLLQITELKILGAELGISSIQTNENKLMLTRNDDFITLGGKFPRLTKSDPKSRIQEIKKLLLAL